MNPDQTKPAAAPAPQPTAVPPVVPKPAAGGKKMSKNAIVAIVAAVVVVAGAIAYGVYAYMANTPDSLLLSAVDNLKDKKSVAATFKVVTGTDQSGVTISGDVAAAMDSANSKNGEVIVGLGTGNTRVALNALSLSGTLYLKATGAENLGTFLSSFGSADSSVTSPAFTSALKNLNGQWFELTQADVQSVAQSGGNSNVTGAVSPDDLKRVLDIYHQHPFVKADKTYADQVIDNTNTAHFSLKIDAATEAAFLQAVKDANLNTIKVTDDDIAAARKEAATSATTTVEVWIARDSRQFKQVKMTNTEKGSESSFTFTLSGTLPTFDKFEKPANTKPASDIMTMLLGSSLSTSSSLSQDELNALEQQSLTQ